MSALVMAWLSGINSTQAQPLPILKDGFCPTGYSAQGNYCVPGRNATVAIPKVGFCPAGYAAQGKYCVGNRQAKPAVLKSGFCPTGYAAQGNYCVQQ